MVGSVGADLEEEETEEETDENVLALVMCIDMLGGGQGLGMRPAYRKAFVQVLTLRDGWSSAW